MQKERVDYWQRIKDIPPSKLVFLDETAFWVGMSRNVAWAEKGKRACSLRKFYRGRKMTMMGAIKQNKVLATKVIEPV